MPQPPRPPQKGVVAGQTPQKLAGIGLELLLLHFETDQISGPDGGKIEHRLKVSAPGLPPPVIGRSRPVGLEDGRQKALLEPVEQPFKTLDHSL